MVHAKFLLRPYTPGLRPMVQVYLQDNSEPLSNGEVRFCLDYEVSKQGKYHDRYQ